MEGMEDGRAFEMKIHSLAPRTGDLARWSAIFFGMRDERYIVDVVLDRSLSMRAAPAVFPEAGTHG